MSSTPTRDAENDGASPLTPGEMSQPEASPMDPMESSLGLEFEVKEQDRWLPIANGSPVPSPKFYS
jgi:hypothetical protein